MYKKTILTFLCFYHFYCIATHEIIIINGTSCSGKTTLAKKIVKYLSLSTNQEWTFASIDHFYKNYLKYYKQVLPEKKSGIDFGLQVIDKWHQEICIIAMEKNIVIDHVFDYNAIFYNFLERINAVSGSVFFINVYCSKAVAQKRLKKRNSCLEKSQHRRPNIVEEHFDKKIKTINGGKVYDLKIDTSYKSPSECLSVFKRSFRSGKKIQTFCLEQFCLHKSFFFSSKM